MVGFDIAGPEAGYPPGRFADVFGRLVHASFHLTLHAGEGYGLPSIREALDLGAERLGHGVRIVDDIGRRRRPAGRCSAALAAYVRDRRIPLELCPTSNVHSGAAASIETHPFELLRRLRFRVTVNTDNRLMSDVSLSSEFAALEAAFGLGLDEVEWLTLNAMKSAFLPFDERLAMITGTIKPGFARPARGAGRSGSPDLAVRPPDQPAQDWVRGPRSAPPRPDGIRAWKAAGRGIAGLTERACQVTGSGASRAGPWGRSRPTGRSSGM